MNIGLTYTGREDKHQDYYQWLKGFDNDIVITRLSETLGNEKDIEQCDALVLSGGVDINPALYGGNPDYSNKPKQWNDPRDSFEAAIFMTALDRGIPVLGVCRGMQLINVLQNGTLIQDLGTANKIHEGSPDKEHTIIVEKGSLLHSIAGADSGMVNSAHHQAIDKLGGGLKINSRSASGTIEGIEWSDKAGKPFLLGVQWHPERMYVFNLQDSPLSSNIRSRFINEVRNRKR